MATADRPVPRGSALASSDADLEAAAEVRQEDIVLALAWLRLYAPELARIAEAVPYEQENVALALMAGLAAGGTRYSFLTRRGAYYDLRGRRIILSAEVRRMLDKALDRAGRDARQRTMALRLRTLDLPSWEIQMRQHVKSSTIAAHVTGSGGVRRTHLDALTRMQQTVFRQYTYLSRFAQQIEAGEQPLDGRALQRSGMYIDAARGVHEEARADVAISVGYDERRNIRYPGDSCDGCIKVTDLEWVTLDDPRWIPIGNRDCRTNCRCGVDYRNSADGTVQSTYNPKFVQAA